MRNDWIVGIAGTVALTVGILIWKPLLIVAGVSLLATIILWPERD
jgi:hypothetical protein